MPLHLTRRVLDRLAQRWFTAGIDGATQRHHLSRLRQHAAASGDRALLPRLGRPEPGGAGRARGRRPGRHAMLAALAGARRPRARRGAKLGQAAALGQPGDRARSGSPPRACRARDAGAGRSSSSAPGRRSPTRLQTRLGRAHATLGRGAALGPRMLHAAEPDRAPHRAARPRATIAACCRAASGWAGSAGRCCTAGRIARCRPPARCCAPPRCRRRGSARRRSAGPPGCRRRDVATPTTCGSRAIVGLAAGRREGGGMSRAPDPRAVAAPQAVRQFAAGRRARARHRPQRRGGLADRRSRPVRLARALHVIGARWRGLGHRHLERRPFRRRCRARRSGRAGSLPLRDGMRLASATMCSRSRCARKRRRAPRRAAPGRRPRRRLSSDRACRPGARLVRSGAVRRRLRSAGRSRRRRRGRRGRRPARHRSRNRPSFVPAIDTTTPEFAAARRVFDDPFSFDCRAGTGSARAPADFGWEPTGCAPGARAGARSPRARPTGGPVRRQGSSSRPRRRQRRGDLRRRERADRPRRPRRAAPPGAPRRPAMTRCSRPSCAAWGSIRPMPRPATRSADMQAFGREYRMMAEGLMHLLRLRAQEKGSARIAQTVVGASRGQSAEIPADRRGRAGGHAGASAAGGFPGADAAIAERAARSRRAPCRAPGAACRRALRRHDRPLRPGRDRTGTEVASAARARCSPAAAARSCGSSTGSGTARSRRARRRGSWARSAPTSATPMRRSRDMTWIDANSCSPSARRAARRLRRQRPAEPGGGHGQP